MRRSIAGLEAPGATTASLSTGAPRMAGGKSQSAEIPTSAPARPRPATISVALGTSETIRIPAPPGAADPRAPTSAPFGVPATAQRFPRGPR